MLTCTLSVTEWLIFHNYSCYLNWDSLPCCLAESAQVQVLRMLVSGRVVKKKKDYFKTPSSVKCPLKWGVYTVQTKQFLHFSFSKWAIIWWYGCPLKQRSPTPGPWTSTGSWVIGTGLHRKNKGTYITSVFYLFWNPKCILFWKCIGFFGTSV